MADMELRLGRLRDAEQTFDHALELAEANTQPARVMRGTADMLVGLSRMAWYRNDLAAAAEFLRRADELGEAASLPQNPYRWRVGMARLRAAEGDLAAALELLDEAERVYVGDYSPNVQPVHASRARVLAARGDLAGARAWARDHEVAVDDELSYFREYEHITLARVLLAEHAATGSRRQPSTTPRRSPGSSACRGYRRRPGRVGHRARGAPSHRVRRDRGPGRGARGASSRGRARRGRRLGPGLRRRRVRPDAAASRALAAQPRSGFAHALLDAVMARTPRRRPAASGAGSALRRARRRVREPRAGLVDPLSDRELDVLRLLGSDLDGPAIARQLVVSLNTVRTHTKHIYTKLGVNNRRAAISRAHQLGLLTRSGAR